MMRNWVGGADKTAKEAWEHKMGQPGKASLTKCPKKVEGQGADSWERSSAVQERPHSNLLLPDLSNRRRN